jgi:hypothetical protein
MDEDNIASVSHNVGGTQNVHNITENANNWQNIQKVNAGQREENIQYIESSPILTENVQYADRASSTEDTASRRELGLGRSEAATRSSTERASGLDPEFIGNANSDFSDGSTSGKGGLTTMAQGEISFRDRAIQNGRSKTKSALSGSGNDTDTLQLQLRLQALQARNAQVAQKLNQLESSTGSVASFSASAESVSGASQAMPAPANSTSTSNPLSALKKWTQSLSQNVNGLTRSQPTQGGFA